MDNTTFNVSKTGPIHMPKDGRSELVQVIDLIKTFGKNEAVKGVSFTIGKGEIFGLLGPNGAGKSTTINIMCGYLEPTSGDTISRRNICESRANARKKPHWSGATGDCTL